MHNCLIASFSILDNGHKHIFFFLATVSARNISLKKAGSVGDDVVGNFEALRREKAHKGKNKA